MSIAYNYGLLAHNRDMQQIIAPIAVPFSPGGSAKIGKRLSDRRQSDRKVLSIRMQITCKTPANCMQSAFKMHANRQHSAFNLHAIFPRFQPLR